jgi:hypothetical protein
MELNEVKKSLYKEKPVATFTQILKGICYYETSLQDGTKVFFSVPHSDMGDASFTVEMNAQLLNRWIVQSIGQEVL